MFYPHFSVLSQFQRFIANSVFYPHFSVLSLFQRFIPISAFYPHFSVLSLFQRFIPISAFYPHFSVLSPFQFPFSVSVSAIQFQRFIQTRAVTCNLSRNDFILWIGVRSVCQNVHWREGGGGMNIHILVLCPTNFFWNQSDFKRN